MQKSFFINNMFIYLSNINNQKQKMATVKTNIWNLKVGDKITFTNYVGCKKEITITRITDKSWFSPNRNSFGTFADYEKSFKDFKIIRNHTINCIF